MPVQKKKIKEEPVFPDYGKIQPQALEVEKAVLGAVLLERDSFSLISDFLTPESFYDEKHRLIYQSIIDLYINSKPVDILTVTERLKETGNLDSAGGIVYISTLTDNITSSSHIDFHAKIIAQKFLSRQLIRHSATIFNKAFDDNFDIDDLLQEAESGIFDISQRYFRNDAVPVNVVLKEAINSLQYSNNEFSGLCSGFSELDKITSGWQNSDLVIIAARPAMGKTAFVLSMAKNMTIDFNFPIAIFSLEMSKLQLVNRLLSNVCEISGDTIKNRRLDSIEWQRLDAKINQLYNAPLFIDDSPNLSILELRSKARRLVKEHNIKCIIVDYLQLMNADSSSRIREQEVSLISRSLKALAKELNIPIIALSQLNRGVESRSGADGKRPLLSDLRESGAIEQDADIVCFIHRPEYYGIKEDSNGNDLTGMAEIIIAKHRNGITGDVRLLFQKNYVRFINPNPNQNPIPNQIPVPNDAPY